MTQAASGLRYYQAAYDQLSKLGRLYEAEKVSLQHVAPIISIRHQKNKLLSIQKDVLEIAKNTNVSGKSLVLIAVLSCLYEPRDGTGDLLGRKILKPKKDYSDSMTHNALSDLRALEMLIVANVYADQAVAFCTRDKYLAAFWCAIQASPQLSVNDTVNFEMKLGSKIFPLLSGQELIKLSNTLSKL